MNVKQQSNEYLRSLCDLLVMIGPVIPFLSSELWTILQQQIKINIDHYNLVKYLFLFLINFFFIISFRIKVYLNKLIQYYLRIILEKSML